MGFTITAKFDGSVFVPDAPVRLAPNQAVRLDVTPERHAHTNGHHISPEQTLRGLEQLRDFVSAPPLTNEQMRRENMYEDRP